MLVLSRKTEESIFIGSDIRVTVLSVANGRVKLGIHAPRSKRILRGELAENEACFEAAPVESQEFELAIASCEESLACCQ